MQHKRMKCAEERERKKEEASRVADVENTRLALSPKRKQKYQNDIIHRKLTVPTSTILCRPHVQCGKTEFCMSGF